ncbi:hypothetical protein [Paenibacillus amylolyticus]|uniref:hypothetical protein n=1 Tax=Paenibacillus amylolyticus TaxID=1451 RepID=UPI00201D9082|nr:hypothetical protein [Paenibacillus amylolyticus]MCL6663443.1 hypothetical protein [Paenibacillus amylolyticus]
MQSRAGSVLKTYGIPIVLGLIALIIVLFIWQQNKKIDVLESDIAATKELLQGVQSTKEKVEEPFDSKEHEEILQSRTVSAKKIGAEIIAVEDVLTSFYKSNEDLPEDQAAYDKMVKELDKAKADNTRLTNASESDHIQTWKLNPDWTLKLETIVTYQDTENVPVLFSMTTKSGKSAGLIFAVYDTVNYKLTNISRHYTTDGLDDEIDVGGA